MHRRVATNQTEGKVVTLNMKQHDGLAGAITRDKNAVMPGSVYTSPLPDLLKDISDNMVVSAAISPPAMPPGYVFQSRILPGVRLPKPVRAWMGRDGARLESAESTLSVSHLSARAAPRIVQELSPQELFGIGRGGRGHGGGGPHGAQNAYNHNMQQALAAGHHQAFLAPEHPPPFSNGGGPGSGGRFAGPQGFSAPPPGPNYGAPPPGYGRPPAGFGPAPSGYGPPPPGFGGPPPPGYWAPPALAPPGYAGGPGNGGRGRPPFERR